MGYYLADGIYPSWATFVKTIPEPQGNKKKYFAKAQEACRKDVERAFGVLQSRFAIVRGAARMWDEDTLHDIMMACIIMHNMIVEDERDDYEYNFDNKGQYVYNYDDMGERVSVSHDDAPKLEAFIQNYKKNQEQGNPHSASGRPHRALVAKPWRFISYRLMRPIYEIVVQKRFIPIDSYHSLDAEHKTSENFLFEICFAFCKSQFGHLEKEDVSYA